jgi:tyrosine-protein kinase Etk/Wzc
VARRHASEEPAPNRMGAEHYAWGGERLEIEQLELGEPAASALFFLEAGDADGTYVLYDARGDQILEGRAGELERAAEVSILVATLEARPRTRFRLVKHSWLRAIHQLRSRLTISEQGLGTGILELRLRGTDPDELEEVLNKITETHVLQHVDRRSAEARQSLDFLDDKLPELRAELEAAEDAFNEFRRGHRAVDLGADAEHLLAQIVDVETDLVELELRRLEEGRRFTAEHPRMRTLARQESQLRSTKADLERRVGALPSREQEALRLRRQVDVATELYTSLLNTAQELRVVQAGTTGDVRILDPAVRPDAPVYPQRTLMLAMSTIVGLVLGLGLVFGRQALQRTVRDPSSLELATGLPVHSVIPRSHHEKREARSAERRRAPRPLLAVNHPQDVAVEGLRGLRTSLQLQLSNAAGHVLVFASPRDHSGTSFVCMNAASVFAEAGKRVLVIDGDMRRGSLQRYAGGARTPGLADVLAGMPLGEAVRVLDPVRDGADEAADGHAGGKLFLLPTGMLPSNPSELLVGDAFSEMLEEARTLFDLVLVDTPPLLPVSDAVIVSAHADAIVMVVRAGRSELHEVETGVKRLRQNDLPLTGFLFNDVVLGRAGRDERIYEYPQVRRGWRAGADR